MPGAAPGARSRRPRAQGKEPLAVPEPGIVDYARSMVPVVVFVLVLRSFLFEPFRIPSDSMMPTLQDGDFILVNKFHYGLRLPVLNTKILSIDEPQRGDVVVFRYPRDPAINYIKRVVGLPGDRVKVIADRIYVNDVPLRREALEPLLAMAATKTCACRRCVPASTCTRHCPAMSPGFSGGPRPLPGLQPPDRSRLSLRARMPAASLGASASPIRGDLRGSDRARWQLPDDR